MSYRAIVSNWNGTLFKNPTDEELNKAIGYGILDDAKRALGQGILTDPVQALRRLDLSRAKDLVNLAMAKYVVKKRLAKHKAGQKPLYEVYEAFNQSINGQRVELIYQIVDDFARKSADLVDIRILKPLGEAHNRGRFVGILSTSYTRAIKKILAAAGYGYTVDKIEANVLHTDDNNALGFSSEIWGEKPAVFRDVFMKERGFRDDEIIYISDSWGGDDDETIEIARMIRPGNFIAAFNAKDEFKQKMAKICDAFVPDNEEDLRRYLQLR